MLNDKTKELINSLAKDLAKKVSRARNSDELISSLKSLKKELHEKLNAEQEKNENKSKSFDEICDTVNEASFKDFEKTVGAFPGAFFYGEFEIADKVFYVKFFRSTEGEEVMVMNDEKEEDEPQNSSNLEDLLKAKAYYESEIESAVKQKNFDYVSSLSTRLSQVKEQILEIN